MLNHCIGNSKNYENIRNLLWVSLEDFDCIPEGIKSGVQLFSFFGNSFWFAKLLDEGFVLVDVSVEFELEFFLRGLDQEEANGLRDGVSHTPEHDSEVGINSHPDLVHKQIVASLLLHHIILLGVVAGRVVLRGLVLLRFGLRHNVRSILEVVRIIGEEVVLLCINDCLYHIPAFVPLGLQNLSDDVHYFWDHAGEP